MELLFPVRRCGRQETPQVVHAQTFLEGVKKFTSENFTDDLRVIEALGKKTALIKASPRNRKITTKEDLPEDLRVGIGEDSHAFKKMGLLCWPGEDKKICLGSMRIQTEMLFFMHALFRVLLACFSALCNKVV